MTTTFFGAPSVPDPTALDAQVAFLGVPYDRGTPPGLPTGQRGGPAAARAASVEQFVAGESWYDVETGREHLVGVTMADAGNEGDYDRLSAVTAAIAARGALLAAFGGDHAISFPLGRGLEALGEFDVVHVDAHADFYDEVDGSRATGASQLRRLAELPFVGMISALGLRNADRSEIEDIRAHGGRFATTRDVLERGPAVVRETVRERPLYVSIDLDVLDASVAPGHSLPEPGGLSYRELRALLAAVAQRGRVIGFDVVELNPALDPSGMTARVAAWTATHFLSDIFDQSG